jgi:hypothetical protein
MNITAIHELVFLVTLVGNVTVLVKLYDNNTLCKACSCTLTHRIFIFQSPYNRNFFLFYCTLPISVSNLSKNLHISLCGDP